MTSNTASSAALASAVAQMANRQAPPVSHRPRTRESYFAGRYTAIFGEAPEGLSAKQISDAVTSHERAAETETLRDDLSTMLEGLGK